jgi:hypothetical protein
MTKSNKMTKSVKNSKNSVVSAVSEWVLNTLSSSLSKEQIESVRETFESRKNDLHTILSLNIKDTSTSKKVKDPNAPKRSKTSYIFFCLEHRDHIKKNNPDISAKDIIKELGTMWRNTPDDKKQKYLKMAENDKERYSGELSDYVPTITETQAPKRSLTSYIFFCKEQRNLLKEQQPNLSTKDLTTELGKRWKSLSDDQKLPYVKLAENDKTRYNSQKNTQHETTKTPKETTKTPKETTKIPKETNKTPKETNKTPKETKKTPNESKKTPKETTKTSKESKKNTKSGFNLFCKEERDSVEEENPKWSTQQVSKELEKYWNDLSTDEQVEYNNRAS